MSQKLQKERTEIKVENFLSNIKRQVHIFSHVQWTHNLWITLTSFLFEYGRDATVLSPFMQV